MTADDSEPERLPFYHPKFLTDVEYWNRTAPATATRLLRIVDEALRTPFTGIGKPEPLRHDLQGRWARRLTKSDRVIYRVSRSSVEFFSARDHYPR